MIVFMLSAPNNHHHFICILYAVSRASNMNTDEIREGAEAKNWKQKTEENKHTIKMIYYVLNACLTVYLPVSRICMQILACGKEGFTLTMY
jgi:hypothetical protein